MSPPVNIAIIGSSGIADTYAAILNHHDSFSLKAIHSRDSSRAMSFAQKHNIALSTSSLDEILGNDNINALLVCTEPDRHLEVALKGLEHEKHLLIEKPVTSNIEEAEKLQKAIKDKDLSVNVVSQKRFDPNLQLMKKSYDSLKSGPAMVSLSFFWKRDIAYYNNGNKWRATSSVFLNQGIHWLDILNWFFGTPVQTKAISKITRQELNCVDHSHAVIEYPNGVVANVSGGTFSKISQGDIFSIRHPEKVINLADFSRPNASLSQKIKNKIIKKQLFEDNLHKKQLDDFYTCIYNKRESSTSLESGIAALRLALEISHS